MLEYAGVHYFTKVGSGERTPEDDDDEWEDDIYEEELEIYGITPTSSTFNNHIATCPEFKVFFLTNLFSKEVLVSA